MFIKDETRISNSEKKKMIYVACSDSLMSGYRRQRPVTSGEYNAEGPTAIKIDGKWIVYFDKYMDHKFGAVSSTDLVHWTDISDQLTMPKGIRHGTVFKISRKEFEKITQLLSK